MHECPKYLEFRHFIGQTSMSYNSGAVWRVLDIARPHSPQVCGPTLRAALADREWRYLDICVKSLRPGGVPYAYLCIECVCKGVFGGWALAHDDSLKATSISSMHSNIVLFVPICELGATLHTLENTEGGALAIFQRTTIACCLELQFIKTC